MATTWRKAKAAIGTRLCVYVPTTPAALPGEEAADRPATAPVSPVPTTPTASSSGLRMSRSGSRSPKKTCSICLDSMKPGRGHALFTAECSHTFHYRCIVSNVKHGNQVCPVCRSRWKEIPFQGPAASFEFPHGRARVNPDNFPPEDPSHSTIFRRLPSSRHPEPSVYDDDERLNLEAETPENSQSQHGCIRTVDIKTYPEFSALPRAASRPCFAILIHLKAPHVTNFPPSVSQNSRAPIDLVTVLDVSGSMAGSKLALLKRAMGFVIQNLGPSDRLSVIAFSSSARRLFPLRRMSDGGRQHALQAVNSLKSGGGTNIAEGLQKGSQVMEDRKEKNPISGIILLSDGQDTYTISSTPHGAHPHLLVPPSIRIGVDRPIPVHAFGFGSDHDSITMHSISEATGGTFSFIEAEDVIQDAFAQCIGGLLSVVVQELQVELECVQPGVLLAPIRSGSYASRVIDAGRTGFIDVGNLYADEERDFLVSVNILPAGQEEITLLRVGCHYRDPVSKEMVSLEGREVRIQRPDIVVYQTMSIEVDRENNRIMAAEAMAEAREEADRGALLGAVSILEECRSYLAETLAARSGDRMCASLDAELKEMVERMDSWQRYESSGRAYVLSGLSSHSWQRATARGDSTDSTTLVHAYQTPSMVDMVQRSQTLNLRPR